MQRNHIPDGERRNGSKKANAVSLRCTRNSAATCVSSGAAGGDTNSTYNSCKSCTYSASGLRGATDFTSAVSDSASDMCEEEEEEEEEAEAVSAKRSTAKLVFCRL